MLVRLRLGGDGRIERVGAGSYDAGSVHLVGLETQVTGVGDGPGPDSMADTVPGDSASGLDPQNGVRTCATVVAGGASVGFVDRRLRECLGCPA